MSHYRRIGHGLGACLLFAVMVVSLAPAPELPGPQLTDKLLHFLTYAFLGAWYGSLWHPHLGRVLLAGLAFGALIEGLQALTPYRSAEWLDWIADGAGLLAGLAALHLWYRNRAHATAE